MAKRRQYSVEFKREAVRLVQEENLSYTQVGRDLGVDRSVIRAWVKKAEAGELETSAPRARTDASIEEELRRLRRENAILREERDILKKAAAFFAKESQ
ncbi:MAG: transposase [Myxococcota bacterium]|nr:transposase [Myxococcota bacterium]